jgi:hypothetical protein
MSQAQDAAGAPPGTFFGAVRAVNANETVSVDGGGGYRTSVLAGASYSPRNVGDSVLVMRTSYGPVVLCKIGDEAPNAGTIDTTQLSVSDNAAPAGWDPISGVWGKPGKLWVQRTTAGPAATSGSVSRIATSLRTYDRFGAMTQSALAEQGDDNGSGLQTGMATFGAGAWAGLSGKSPTGGTLTVHRAARQHGVSWLQVTITALRCLAATPPATPPPFASGAVLLTAALDESPSAALDSGWCSGFADGTYDAIGFHTGVAQENVEIDFVSLTINY